MNFFLSRINDIWVFVWLSISFTWNKYLWYMACHNRTSGIDKIVMANQSTISQTT